MLALQNKQGGFPSSVPCVADHVKSKQNAGCPSSWEGCHTLCLSVGLALVTGFGQWTWARNRCHPCGALPASATPLLSAKGPTGPHEELLQQSGSWGENTQTRTQSNIMKAKKEIFLFQSHWEFGITCYCNIIVLSWPIHAPINWFGHVAFFSIDLWLPNQFCLCWFI